MQKVIKNLSNIDAKSMPEQGMQQVWEMMPKGSHNDMKMIQKLIRKSTFLRKVAFAKSMFFLGKTTLFEVQGVPKAMPKHTKTDAETVLEKSMPK